MGIYKWVLSQVYRLSREPLSLHLSVVLFFGPLAPQRHPRRSGSTCIFHSCRLSGHGLWAASESTRSQMRAAEIIFLPPDVWAVPHRARSPFIREGIRVEPLPLHIERSRMRGPWHLIRMPPAHSTGRRPRTFWRVCVSQLDWELLRMDGWMCCCFFSMHPCVCGIHRL